MFAEPFLRNRQSNEHIFNFMGCVSYPFSSGGLVWGLVLQIDLFLKPVPIQINIVLSQAKPGDDLKSPLGFALEARKN